MKRILCGILAASTMAVTAIPANAGGGRDFAAGLFGGLAAGAIIGSASRPSMVRPLIITTGRVTTARMTDMVVIAIGSVVAAIGMNMRASGVVLAFASAIKPPPIVARLL